jgi:2-polyprenyl-3-methyl-5-hydroxy-6-metoxy-1,4-benzoquinol methylase
MIETWSRGAADDNMAEDILVHLEPAIRRHPWWKARAKLLLSLLDRAGVRSGARVLDAGCGWGVTLDALERSGYRASGLDISRRALERLDHPTRKLIEADLVSSLPANKTNFDAVVALDVIEHIDNDRAALKNLCRLTRPGGVAIVSVPALPELYTEFDRVQGHRRRYVPATLTHAFTGSGLTIERMLWWGAWLVPVLRVQRRRSRGRPDMSPLHVYAEYVKVPRWPFSAALRLGFAIDHHRTLRNRTRQGTSLIAVARRAHG